MINPTGQPICPKCSGNYGMKNTVDNNTGLMTGGSMMTYQDKQDVCDLLNAIGMHP